MRLSALYRYPLKSARGERIEQGACDALGLAGDRRWMLVDAASGQMLTQRVLPRMALLGAAWQGEAGLVLSAPGMPALAVDVPDASCAARSVKIWQHELQAPDAGDAATAWLSELLGRACRLVHLPLAQGIQVDPAFAQPGERTAFSDGFPYLLIGQASLDDLIARVGRPLEILRFRPNLVIQGAEPYAEDRWQRIRIGEMAFRVVKPCSRCVIPTLDPLSGERSPDREPLATLMGYRKGEGGVVFGQNLIAEGPGELHTGMPVTVLD